MIASIVAVELGHGIGFNGSMPWPRLKEDMKWFKELTTNHIVIMGSTTWAGFAKPLPNRINVVISRHNQSGADHCYKKPTDAIAGCQLLYPNKHIFIIGGQALYDSTMQLVDKFYVTELDAAYECDKFFDLTSLQQTAKCNHLSHVDLTISPVAFTIKEYLK